MLQLRHPLAGIVNSQHKFLLHHKFDSIHNTSFFESPRKIRKKMDEPAACHGRSPRWQSVATRRGCAPAVGSRAPGPVPAASGRARSWEPLVPRTRPCRGRRAAPMRPRCTPKLPAAVSRLPWLNLDL
jgi:hypothetical protein